MARGTQLLPGLASTMSANRSQAKFPDAEQELGIDHLREVVSRVLSGSPEIAAAYAFGSRVSGRPLRFIDLDLAFASRKDADLAEDPLLAERLSARIAAELRTSMEVDGHLAARLPLNVRGRVVTEGVLLYEADPKRRACASGATCAIERGGARVEPPGSLLGVRPRLRRRHGHELVEGQSAPPFAPSDFLARAQPGEHPPSVPPGPLKRLPDADPRPGHLLFV